MDQKQTSPLPSDAQQHAAPLPHSSVSPSENGRASPLKSAFESTAIKLEFNVDVESRRTDSASTVSPQRHVYWRPPTTMVVSLLIGIGCSVALHVYYSSLNGTPVGSSDDQQQALRIGTALAFFAQVTLVFSMQKSSVQWLWRELKKHVISFKGVDAAFAAGNDPFSFFNREMLWKAKLASTIALLAWLIPFTSFITPATLNVETLFQNTTQVMNVSTLGISTSTYYARFSYATWNESADVQPRHMRFLGPRTVTTRLAHATATTGNILTLPIPATNATYQQIYFGPYIQCTNSTTEVSSRIDAMIERTKQELDPAVTLVQMNYFAAVPALDNFRNDSQTDVQIANLSDISSVQHASNQLWISHPDFVPDRNFSGTRTPRYMTCELWNASYTMQFTWRNGRQDLELVNRDLLHTVDYPVSPTGDAASKEIMAYSAVMWALSAQLTGSIGFYRDLNATNNPAETSTGTSASRGYSFIDTPLAQTVLLGATDLNAHFAQDHLWGVDSNPADRGPLSAQRLQDTGFAGNRSLMELIPELSVNATLSLITDPYLAPPAPANVTITAPATVYSYQSRNVLLAYCLAGGIAIIANALGLWVMWRSGCSHDTSFSSIACTTHAVHFSRLRAHERLGALPLDPAIARTRLEFHNGENGRWGFGAANGQPERV